MLYVLLALSVSLCFGVFNMDVNTAALIVIFWLMVIVMGYLFSRDELKKDKKVDK